MMHDFIESSGNVFEDLGCEKPHVQQMKADIILAILKYAETLDNNVVTIDSHPVLTESVYLTLSKKIKLPVEEIKDILKGKTSNWSLENLLGLLDIIDYKYVINIYGEKHD